MLLESFWWFIDVEKVFSTITIGRNYISRTDGSWLWYLVDRLWPNNLEAKTLFLGDSSHSSLQREERKMCTAPLQKMLFNGCSLLLSEFWSFRDALARYGLCAIIVGDTFTSVWSLIVNFYAALHTFEVDIRRVGVCGLTIAVLAFPAVQFLQE